jgi:hypothetical protein
MRSIRVANDEVVEYTESGKQWHTVHDPIFDATRDFEHHGADEKD